MIMKGEQDPTQLPPLSDRFREWLKALWSKISALLLSRKFWALVTAVVLVAQKYSLGEIDAFQALQLLIAAIVVYIGSVAVEDGLRGR